MTEHFNKLTPAEAERLALLMEECGEVVQIVGKIFRHGAHSHHPDKPDGPSNIEHLMKEIGDVFHAVDRLVDAEDLDREEIELCQASKSVLVKKYLHHQGQPHD